MSNRSGFELINSLLQMSVCLVVIKYHYTPNYTLKLIQSHDTTLIIQAYQVKIRQRCGGG